MIANAQLVGIAGEIADTRPQVINWPQRPTPVGLLYTPEVLSALAAESPQLVSPRIYEAIREQTPIVVLWTFPASANSEPLPRPFSTVIVDERGHSFGGPAGGQGVRIEPLWVDQHADDLRKLDRRTEFSEVGVMAAYPRVAFVLGRIVTIYRKELGRNGGTERLGLIQWNGIGP
jgi:hypothetical protein